jgi:hypothetical protein
VESQGNAVPVTQAQVDKPLSRNHPWVRYKAAYGFPLRMFYCMHCGAKQEVTSADGIDKMASTERRFVRMHKVCPARESE